MYTVQFKKSAEKELEKLPNQIIRRISRAIDGFHLVLVAGLVSVMCIVG